VRVRVRVCVCVCVCVCVRVCHLEITQADTTQKPYENALCACVCERESLGVVIGVSRDYARVSVV
jgi:hypothetical protein